MILFNMNNRKFLSTFEKNLKQVNLVIDIGNSSAKIALFDKGRIIANHCYHDLTTEIIDQLTEQYPKVKKAILSTTRQHNPKQEQHLQKKIPNTIILNHQTPIPLQNLYATPQTLGMDRLAATIGAWSIAPNQDLLIFDLGTAITVDKVTKNGQYVGGNIAPGLDMRFRALNHYTQRLPLLDYNAMNEGFNQTFGDSTTSALWCGVVRGIEHEIQGYMAQNPSAVVFFTGADAKYFVKSVKSAIFADYQLVVKGLDRIIEYNAEKSEF